MPGTTELQDQLKDELIDRYLNSRLDDVERAAFEIAMLEDEQLFARVQLLDAFKNALIEERGALSVGRELSVPPFRAWLRQPLSLAASVLVLALGLQVVYDTASTRSVAPAAVGVDSVFVLEATRGGNRPALAGMPPYLFQIDAGPGAANTTATVSLRTADGAELLRVNALPVDSNGWARLVFAQALSGNYTIELAPAAGSSNSSVQTFELSIND